MITEEQWIKFAQHVKVGSRIKWTYGDEQACGVLLENYPHFEISICKQDPTSNGPYDLLQAKFDDGRTLPILAQYEYFWMEDDQTWYRFDDILMFED